MRRRLDHDGEMVLARWVDHYQPDKETRSLIAEALEVYGADQAQIRFYSKDDPFNPGITIVAPRDDLTVHVRICGDGLFTLVRIIEASGQFPEDDQLRD